MATACRFCAIVAGEVSAALVHEDDEVLAFLDTHPLFPGHTLVVPRVHAETLGDLPAKLVEPVFRVVGAVSAALQAALGAEGAFIAVNERVSQSVPHLHVHVVPRRKGDGLRGFFWPRTRYDPEERAEEVAAKLRAATAAVLARGVWREP